MDFNAERNLHGESKILPLILTYLVQILEESWYMNEKFGLFLAYVK